MPWFKVDDAFHASRKVRSIPPRQRFAAVGLWAIAGSWCSQEMTDGHVPDYMIREWGATEKVVDALVDCGLWERGESGYRIVNWRKHSDGEYRRNIRKSVREAVMRRDGNRCVACGAENDLSLDHIVRYRDGGPDTVENLRVLCMPCNQERG